MKIQEVWWDGRCKKCGSNVYEKGCGNGKADYQNACSNQKCEENHWHYVYDSEFADYYYHKGSAELEKMTDDASEDLINWLEGKEK